MLQPASHRLRQFVSALRPRVDAQERTAAYGYLSAAQLLIFESMLLRDQQHGIEVLRRVRRSGLADDALCTAALLHDCGKGGVALWQRVGHVLLGAIAPGLRARIAAEHGAAWRSSFWRLLHHPDIGAAFVAQTGADAEVVRLIREQEAERPDARLALLQAADSA